MPWFSNLHEDAAVSCITQGRADVWLSELLFQTKRVCWPFMLPTSYRVLRMKATTLKAAQVYLADRRITISRKDDEYRVNLRDGGTEDTAYYTNDLQDAVDTGNRMATVDMIEHEERWGLWPRLPMTRLNSHTKGNDDALGVLTIGGNAGAAAFILYLCNAFLTFRADTPFIHYATANQVAADGWRVD